MAETETLVEAPTKARICKTVNCKLPLTYIEESKCWRCLICNPILETQPAEKIKNKYIDITMTEEMVREIVKEELQSIDEAKTREIVQDELANWHIQKPPVTRDEITEAVGVHDGGTITVDIKVPKPETWMQKAKRLGVRTHNDGTGGMRKKVDIMADMKAKEHPIISEEKLLENIEKVDKAEREADAQIPEEFRTEE